MGSRVADCRVEDWSSVYPHQLFAIDLEDAMQTWIGAREDTPLIDASQCIEAGAMECADPSRLSLHRAGSVTTTSKPDADEIRRRARMFHGACEVLCLVGPSYESVDESEFLVWNPGTSAIEELFDLGHVVSRLSGCVTFDERVLRLRSPLHADRDCR